MGKLWLVEERPNALFAGHVEICTNHHTGRLEGDVARALGLQVGRHSWYDIDRAESANCYRLLRCVICRQRFIGWHSRRTCSDACRTAIYQRVLADAKAKRQARRKAEEARKAERQARFAARPKRIRHCEACGKPLEQQRSTKRFCDAVCRQRGHRRAKALSPKNH